MKHINYSSIGQFRNAVKNVQLSTAYQREVEGKHIKNPTIKFTGTVKAHGTNASIVISPEGEQYAQSRTAVLSLSKDNAGFAAFAHSVKDTIAGMRVAIELLNPDIEDKTIVIYGEWCGKGIQKGVGISEVDRFFMPFGVKVLEEKNNRWLTHLPMLTSPIKRIFDVREFGTFEILVDFEHPEEAQNTLVNITEQVEKQCHIAQFFGIAGIGEGVVWTSPDQEIKFKVKGEKHSNSKVKKLAEVDVEKLNSIKEFVDYAVTENRLKQMFLENVGTHPDRALLGKFIKAVSTDVVKEEPDTLVASGLSMKDVGSALSKKARNWFFEQEKL